MLLFKVNRISPSSLNYRKQCRAYESTHTDNAAATEGTLLHAAIENEFFDALDAEQMELVNKCLSFLTSQQKRPDEFPCPTCVWQAAYSVPAYAVILQNAAPWSTPTSTRRAA